jgi:hypothetical protein
MYCDTCSTNMLVDEFGAGTFREAVREAIDNAIHRGCRRTRKGWQCPGCLVGMPNVFDMEQGDLERRAIARRKYREKFGVELRGFT